MYPASSEGLNKETEKAVYFFTPAFHPLDSFSAHAVTIWNVTFPTAEHAYHWKKFSDSYPEIANEILAAKSPEMAQQIAHANKIKQPASWHQIKVGIMEQIFQAKAEQNKDVQEILKRTGQREIIENTPIGSSDDFWGAGVDSKGQNMVGKIWMKIRDSYY